MVLQYGSAAQKKLSDFSESALDNVRTKDLGEVGNLVTDLVGELKGFDIEIIEKHHHNKLDAPSGTALMLADAAKESVDYSAEYVYERQSVRRKRAPEEIGIHSIRGGSIVGEHDVIFAGTDEVITLSHNAASREVFAQGALRAAAYMKGKAPGRYNMENVIEG